MFLNTTTFDTNSTPIPVNSMSTIFSFLFCSTRRILLDHFKMWEFLLLQILVLLLRILFRHLTRGFTTDSMSSPMGTASRFRVVIGLTSALLCHTRFPTVDSLSQNTARHLSHCEFLQTSLLGSGRNWEYYSQDKLE